VMEDKITASMDGIVQVFGEVPEQFDDTVEEMIETAARTSEIGDRFEANQRSAVIRGFDAMQDQIRKDGPQATAAWERVLGNITDAFDLATAMGLEVDGALQALKADTDRWTGLGAFWGSLVGQGFRPNLSVPSPPSGPSPPPSPPSPRFDPSSMLAGVTGGATQAATAGVTQITMSFAGATLVGDQIEDAVLGAVNQLKRDGRI